MCVYSRYCLHIICTWHLLWMLKIGWFPFIQFASSLSLSTLFLRSLVPFLCVLSLPFRILLLLFSPRFQLNRVCRKVFAYKSISNEFSYGKKYDDKNPYWFGECCAKSAIRGDNIYNKIRRKYWITCWGSLFISSFFFIILKHARQLFQFAILLIATNCIAW